MVTNASSKSAFCSDSATSGMVIVSASMKLPASMLRSSPVTRR
jgi:hypothetical protein